MNVLITGISICGKSTLRRKLVSVLSRFEVPFFQYDADGFTTVRDARDTLQALDLEEVANVMQSGARLVLVEDVHGTMKSALNSLSAYDLILYVEPGFFSYFMFWLTRAKRWFENGKFAWTKDKGWEGTEKPHDFQNIPGIAKHLLRACFLRGRWVQDDLRAIYKTDIPVRRIKSRWTTKGPRFTYDF